MCVYPTINQKPFANKTIFVHGPLCAQCLTVEKKHVRIVDSMFFEFIIENLDFIGFIIGL